MKFSILLLSLSLLGCGPYCSTEKRSRIKATEYMAHKDPGAISLEDMKRYYKAKEACYFD